MKSQPSNRTMELGVLALIACGLILIILSVVWGLFLNKAAILPNWAENVLVAISTACALKLGDTLSALVALANGRSVENFGNKLAESQPLAQQVVPADAQAAADQVADAAVEAADKLADTAEQTARDLAEGTAR
jgi:hypothetical protein